MLPATGGTPANVTIANYTSSSSFTNTGLAPAVLSVNIPVNIGACGDSTTQAQAIAVVNGWLARGGIVQLLAEQPDPSQLPNCNWSGTGAAFPGVITPGNAYYNAFMYGWNGSSACTSSAPCGGVWGLAQVLAQITSGHKVILRILHENDLNPADYAWWGTNGTSGPTTNAQFVTLWKQEVTYLKALGVTNALFNYNINNFSGAYSQNDPGAYNASTNPAGRDIVSGDYYGSTTQAGVKSVLTNASAGFTYLQGLGLPFLMTEVGAESSNNGAVSTYTYDNSMWNQGLQSSASNLVGTNIWNQHWCLQCQLNASGYMNNTIALDDLPVITNSLWLIALVRRRRAANDDDFEQRRHG